MTWLWQGGKDSKGIPQWAYPYLVVTLKADPDYLSRLKCFEQMSYMGPVLVNLIRIFDPKEAEGTAKIIDFASLDQYPELIVYEGYIEKRSGNIQIEPGRARKQENEFRGV